MSTRKSGTASKYERRAARQRQLDQMEAEASGTAVTMSLDTSSLDNRGSMRQRNQETARRFLYDEDEAQATTSSSVKNTAGSLFPGRAAGETFGLDTVNLMDHETGIYTQEDTSFSGRLRRYLFGPDRAAPGEMDVMAADSEIYLGEQRASRLSSILVRCRYLCCSSRQRVLITLIALFAMFVGIYSAVKNSVGSASAPHKATPKEILHAQNSDRFTQIMENIISNGLGDHDTFVQDKLAPSRALRWIAYIDPARLDPDDPMLFQRFALATLFYGSFNYYAQEIGQSKNLEDQKDDQYLAVPNVGWYAQDFWLTEHGYCTWYGVDCVAQTVDGEDTRNYNANGNVFAVNLTNNFVFGTIPKEFKALNGLEHLDFSSNRMVGTIPSELQHLSVLRYVKLQDNLFSGVVPTELGLLQSALEIDLSRNRFSGTLPGELNRLSTIRELNVGSNNFTGQFPNVQSLSNLRILRLSDNKFSGTVPFSFALLQHIEEVYLDKNQFSGTLAPEFQTFTHLKLFSATDNLLSGSFPDGIFQSNKELYRVSVQNNRFWGRLPALAGQSSSLVTLEMHNNLLNGTFPTEWTQMPNLQVLHLQNNFIRGSIPATIGNLNTLKELWLTNNSLTGQLPAEISGCSSLSNLYLDHNHLSSLPNPTADLTNMKKLSTVRLEFNSIGGSVPKSICDLKAFSNLKFISVDCALKCTCCSKCY